MGAPNDLPANVCPVLRCNVAGCPSVAGSAAEAPESRHGLSKAVARPRTVNGKGLRPPTPRTPEDAAGADGLVQMRSIIAESER